jgi:hypothetical protein
MDWPPVLRPLTPTSMPPSQPLARPAVTYASLIVQAIAASPTGQCTLAEIYRHVQARYPYYRQCRTHFWKNSIRHNLATVKYFVRVTRPSPDGTRRITTWTVDPGRATTHSPPPPAPVRTSRPAVLTAPTAHVLDPLFAAAAVPQQSPPPPPPTTRPPPLTVPVQPVWGSVWVLTPQTTPRTPRTPDLAASMVGGAGVWWSGAPWSPLRRGGDHGLLAEEADRGAAGLLGWGLWSPHGAPPWAQVWPLPSPREHV